MLSRHTTKFFNWAFIAGITLPACGDDSGESDTPTLHTHDSTSSPDTGSGAQAPTFWQDVAPIYFERCVACHQEGGVAPFRLDTYADAKTYALASQAATQARTMPPWPMQSVDGSCGTYADSPELSVDQITTIRKWVDGGSPEGQPVTLQVPSKPGLTDFVAYQTPVYTPKPEGGDLSKFDEYRCFLVPLGLTGPQFMTGFEVLPGEKRLIHHAVGILVDAEKVTESGETNAQAMARLDAESPDSPGWPCYGLAGEGVEEAAVPIVWAPGMQAVHFPAQSGMAVDPNYTMVVQMHYNFPNGQVEGLSDQTTLRVQYKSSVERQAINSLPDGLLGTLFDDNPHLIPPGEAAHVYTWEFPWEDEFEGLPYLDVWGVFPHMHAAGVSLQGNIVTTQGETCLANVPRWDFAWQLQYFRSEPVRFGPGQRLKVSCTFDTRNRTEPTLPGWGTNNEMCLLGIYAVLPNERDLEMARSQAF